MFDALTCSRRKDDLSHKPPLTHSLTHSLIPYIGCANSLIGQYDLAQFLLQFNSISDNCRLTVRQDQHIAAMATTGSVAGRTDWL